MAKIKIPKQVIIKNSEGVVVVNRIHPDINVLNQFLQSSCNLCIGKNKEHESCAEGFQKCQQ